MYRRIINVKDYGAKGDGSTDDVNAIRAAMAAMTSNSDLVFPAGVYMVSGWLSFDPAHGQVAGTLTNCTLIGRGMGVTAVKYIRTGAALGGGVVLNIPNADTGFTIRDITLDGNCIARIPGQSGIAVAASNTTLRNVEVKNAGQFSMAIGVYDGGVTPVNNVSIIGCRVRDGYADGINLSGVHKSVVIANDVDGADDDCIAVGDNSSEVVVESNSVRSRTTVSTLIPVTSITRSGATATITYPSNNFFTGNPTVVIAGANQAEYNGTFALTNVGDGYTQSTFTVGGSPASPATGTLTMRVSANSGYTTWGRGIAVIWGASDIKVANNAIRNTKQDGLYIAMEGGSRIERVHASSNTIYSSCVNSGSSIAAFGTTDCTLENNTVVDQVIAGNLVDIADWENLTIKGGTLTQNNDLSARGIHVNESSGYANTTWNNLVIKGVTIRLYGASTNGGIYLVPNAANTLDVGLVDNCDVQQVAAGDYITVTGSAATRWKIVNNTDMTGSRTINQSTGGVFTVANNN